MKQPIKEAQVPKDVKPKKRAKSVPAPTLQPPATVATHEAQSWIDGLFQEFSRHVDRYNELTGLQLSLQARLELSEKTLCLTRDHLASAIAQAGAAGAPCNWKPLFNEVRFVGVRLVDACTTLLQEQKKLTSEQILKGLNAGMFRFRTNSPLREIHAALIQQRRRTKKVGDTYVWLGGEEQIPMRLRMATAPQAAGLPLENGPKDQRGEAAEPKTKAS
jgi:hypothetical protein